MIACPLPAQVLHLHLHLHFLSFLVALRASFELITVIRPDLEILFRPTARRHNKIEEARESGSKLMLHKRADSLPVGGDLNDDLFERIILIAAGTNVR